MIGPFQFPFNGQFFWKHCLMASTFHPWKNEKTHLQQPKTLKHPPLCKECKLNLSKYTCPGCSVPSCSLPCVEAHKQHTGCTGKRQRTQFGPIASLFTLQFGAFEPWPGFNPGLPLNYDALWSYTFNLNSS